MNIFGLYTSKGTTPIQHKDTRSMQFHDYYTQPPKDTFVKSVSEDSTKIDNTKKIMEDVIIPNLDSQKAIIKNFDEEKYPNGIVDENGAICVENEPLKKMFETLAEAIPNYGSIYGRRQHPTHQYTLDVHTFKVLKECVNNPRYNELSDREKLILQMTVLLHDIAKPEFVNDRNHPENSAVMAEKLLKNFDFPKETNEKIVNLVRNHNWFEYYNKGQMSGEEILDLLEDKKDFKIISLISEGDTKSVNDWFYSVYCTNLPNAIKEINELL